MTRRAKARALIVGILAALPQVGRAQTSASWTFNGDGNWNDNTKWTPAAFPDGGGTASFSLHPLHSQIRSITLNVPVTLGGLNFNSSYQCVIAPSGANSLTLNGAAAINVGNSNSGSPGVFAAGDSISAPIAGASGLTKTGSGTLTLTTTNTYTGGTTITGGVLRITNGNASLGSTAAGNNITLDGGTLRVITTGLTTARNVSLGAGGGTLEGLANATFTGVISGGGAFNKTLTSALVLQGANTYTGASNFQALGTQVQNVGSAGAITFSGNGTSLSTSAITSGSLITLDNATTNINGRLNPSAPITFLGAGLTVAGNATAATVETVGAVTGFAGNTTFTVTPNAAQPASLTIGSFTRVNKNAQLYRGTNLGSTPGNGVANIYLTAPPALVGGGGAAGTTNISIIPTACGAVVSSGTGSAGSDLVTYGPNGVRPLSNAAGEYATLAAAGPTDNVRISAAETTTASKTVNGLVLFGSLSGSDTITVASGMVLNSPSGLVHTANLDFGPTEGILFMGNTGTMTGRLSGSAGVIKAGGGDITLGNNNTFSGRFTILGGRVTISGDALVNTNSPFGNSSDPIVMDPTTTVQAAISAGVPNDPEVIATISRDIIVRGNGSATAVIGRNVLGSGQIILNGTVTLERQLTAMGSTSKPLVFNGVVQGPGRLTDASSSQVALNNANAYSGGTEINTGSYYVSNDSAFGTGPIWLAATGTGAGTIGAVGAPRTIANPLIVLGNLNIGNTPATGTSADIAFTGDVNLGGGNSGSTPIADGPTGITVPAGRTAAFSGTIHDGGISKAGAGKLILSGNNAYTGGTTVSAGTLQVDNTTGSGTGSNFVNIVGGGVLSGTGSIAGPVSIDTTSTLSPGDSPGTLTNGALTLANGTSLLFDLNQAGIAGGGVNDLDIINGNLVLDGVLTVNPGGLFGNGAYTLFTYSGTLTDNAVSVNPIPGGFTGTVDTTTPGVVSLNVVPEPAMLGLLVVASSAALLPRKRRVMAAD